MYAEAILKKGEGRTLKSGGAWVYDNEIDRVEGDYENGDILAVKDFDGFFLGWGFINTRSKITIRVMSRRKEHEITEEFLEKRVRNAWEYRKATVDTGCCRLIFGEADWLPGLVADKFSDVLVVESLALGIDRLKPTILSLVKKVLAEDGIMIRGIYERSDAKVRLQEGMERFKGFVGDRCKIKLCVGQLPQQEIGNPKLIAGADQKVGLRDSCRIQRSTDLFLGDFLRLQGPCLYLLCQIRHSAADFIPAAVIDRNLKMQTGVVLCRFLQLRNPFADIIIEPGLIPDHAHAHIVLCCTL